MSDPDSRVYRPLRIASIVMALQALVVLIFGVVQLFSHHREFGFGVSAAGFFILYGVGMGLCAWGILDLRRWARGPTLLVELMNIGLAWSLRGENELVSMGLAVPAAVVLVCILLPASVQALEADGGRD